MKLSDLIERLNEINEQYPDSDPEVVLHTQPTYPLEASVAGVATSFDLDEEEPKVYICEGPQIGYGRKTTWAVAS